MEASSTRRTDVPSDRVRQIDWHVVWTWLLCFGLIAYLGLEGGGFDPLVHDQVGIAVWWVLLAALLVGAVPRRPLGPAGWSTVALLAIFAIWSALSLTWTESLERTWADVARVLAYLGVFALALFTRGEGERRQLVAAVGTGIAFVGVIALLSRLHPAWFPASSQTGEFLSSGRERLSYPLNYWNGLAALLAMGLPLVLQAAACARSVLGRALAAAALPLMALAIFFTLSRGGIAASAVVVVVFLAFAGDRLPKLLSLLVAAGGGAILILAAAARDALQHGLANSSAQSQGDEMLWLTLAVCFTAGIVQAGIALIERRHGRPRWLTFNRQQVQIGALLCAAALVVAAIAIGISGRVSNGWNEFKVGGNPGGGTQRLTSAAGQHRYQYWSSAVEEDAHKPLTGTGSGTFEYWWNRNGSLSDTVRDTHSLYFQTLGELGIVGLVLIVAFLAVVLIGGGARVLRSESTDRAAGAAALAAVFGFFLIAAVDWMWQLPVLPVAMLLLASGLLARSSAPQSSTARSMGLPARLCLVGACLIAIGVIAVPLASTSLVRQSQTDARNGRLADALSAARTAQNVEPGAASPRLQEALVLETEGRLGEASAAAQAATSRETTNWRNWVVLSRLEAERGRAGAAVHDYRMARSLNPRSSLFSH